jgi:hypothetical protein
MCLACGGSCAPGFCAKKWCRWCRTDLHWSNDCVQRYGSSGRQQRRPNQRQQQQQQQQQRPQRQLNVAEVAAAVPPPAAVSDDIDEEAYWEQQEDPAFSLSSGVLGVLESDALAEQVEACVLPHGAATSSLLLLAAQLAAPSHCMWVLVDSGATHTHMRSATAFARMDDVPAVMQTTIGDGGQMRSEGSGDVVLCDQRGNIIDLRCRPSMLTPRCSHNIVSINHLAAAGFVYSQTHEGATLVSPAGVRLEVQMRNGLPYLFLRPAPVTVSSAAPIVYRRSTPGSLELWHHRLAHANVRMIATLPHVQGSDVPKLNDCSWNAADNCLSCGSARMHRTSFSRNEEHELTPGAVVWMDGKGPMPASMPQRHTWCWIVYDDASCAI